MRAAGLDRDLPALPGAGLNAQGLQGDGQQAGRDLLAGGDHGVIFAGVVQGGRLRTPADQFIGLAGHGGDDHGHVMASVHLALDVVRNIADAVYIGDGRAAEFHD